MSKIDLGYGTTAEAPGEDIILSTEMPNGDAFALLLHPTQVARLFEFAVREGLIEPNLAEVMIRRRSLKTDPIRLGYGKPVRVPAYFDDGEPS